MVKKSFSVFLSPQPSPILSPSFPSPNFRPHITLLRTTLASIPHLKSLTDSICLSPRFGEIIYGGHITDFFDRRVSSTYLSQLLSPALLKNGEILPKIIAPDSGSKNFLNAALKGLPLECPAVYGKIKLYTYIQLNFTNSNE